MKTPELKPCPFCGGEAELLYKFRSTQDSDNHMLVRARCKDCNAQSPYKRSPKHHGWFDAINKKKAIEAWNRRANDENA